MHRVCELTLDVKQFQFIYTIFPAEPMVANSLVASRFFFLFGISSHPIGGEILGLVKVLR